MIYLRAGLFAEGKTDYGFLLSVIDQLVEAISVQIYAGGCMTATSLGIDAPARMRRASREERIAAAIQESWEECTFFVVHGDGAGAPESARRHLIDPGIERARGVHPDLAAAACVPVRETEAWMLADAGSFCRVFRSAQAPELPKDPEAIADPKRHLAEVLKGMGARTDRGIGKYYADLGREVRCSELDRLPAFRRFAGELRIAIEVAGGRPRS